jgi:rhodanese-related sulfurtransferase
MRDQNSPRKPWWNVLGILGLIVLVYVGVWPFLSKRSVDPPPGKISVLQASALLNRHTDDSSFVLLDVRTPQEYAEKRISPQNFTLLNLDFYAQSFRDQLSPLDRTKTYLIYCRTGNRSSQAMALMKELGFPRIYDLEGGIVAWQEAGLPITVGP